jgi:hypothetical protein
MSATFGTKIVAPAHPFSAVSGNILCLSPVIRGKMVREHFPGSVVTDSLASPPPRGTEVKVEPISWVTPERIWAAINLFGPHKAGGLDKLKPVVLQHLPWDDVEALSSIFTAVIELGYIPARWRTSDVILIDNPGKLTLKTPDHSDQSHSCYLSIKPLRKC